MHKEGHTFRVLSIPEIIFLSIRRAEDVVSSEVHNYDECCIDRPQLDLIEHKVPCLEGVHKWYP